MDDGQVLLEIERIKALKARYFRFLDTQQWERWREVFTDDAEASFEDGPGAPASLIARGADTLVEVVSGRMDGSVTVHHGHMPEIELTSPTTATGVWAMQDVVVHPAYKSRGSSVGYGHYHEDYRKGDDGRWRIARFHLTRLLITPTATPAPRIPGRGA